MCRKQLKGEKTGNFYFLLPMFFFPLPLPPSPSLVLEELWLSLVGCYPVYTDMVSFAIPRPFCSWKDWGVFNTSISGCKVTQFQTAGSLNHWWLIIALERKNEFHVSQVKSQSVFITHRILVSCWVTKDKVDIISFKPSMGSTVLSKSKKAL